MAKGKTFDALIKGDQLVLVDFHADWCGPCHAMAPIIKEVAASVKGKAKIIKVDVDKNPKVSEIYRITGIPTFILFQRGAIKWRHSGTISGHQLEKIIDKHYMHTE